MFKSSHSRIHDSVPTSYAFSALFYASVGVVASAGAVLVTVGGVFAFWRLYVTKSLKFIFVDGMALVLAAVIAYYCAGAVSAFFNPFDSESVSQLVERLPMLFLPVLMQFFSYADSEKLILWVVRGAAIGVFAAGSYWAVIDHFSLARVAALSGNSNIFGYMCSLLFAFLCLGFGAIPHKKERLMCIVALLLCVTLVAISGSRGSVLAIILISIIMIWFCWPQTNTWSRILAAIFFIAAISTFTSVTIVGKRTIGYLEQVIEADLDLSKFDPARVSVWNCGLKIGAEKPFIGRGHDEALDALKSCTSTSFDGGLGFSHFHNLFVDQFAKGGIVGMLSASFLLFLPLILLVRARKSEGLTQGLVAGVLGVWIVQATGALFNIGFGHDAVDAGFIYSNALLFGVINARWRAAQAPLQEVELFMESGGAGSDLNYIKVFSLGGLFAVVLAIIVFLWAANTIGFNRLTAASGGFALQAEEVNQARRTATELREFVDRFEGELIKSESAITLPDADRFHAAASVWREEYLKLSDNSRRQQGISVRKNGGNYKILLSGPICPIAVSSGLFKADPRRKSVYPTLCYHFAVWKGEGVEY